jgi:hypothetical protein
MGALSCLDISKCSLTRGTLKAMPSQGYTRSYWGSKDEHCKLDTAGVIALADTIKNMRAISSVNLLRNHIPVEQAQKLVKIMQSKVKLTTLCGLSKEETLLDFSGQGLDAGDAVLIANDINDMGAISKFTFSGDEDSKSVTMETSMVKAGFSKKGLGVSGAIMLSAFLPKCT